MTTYTILCLSDGPMEAIASRLRSQCELLTTSSASQAMAYLFVNRRIDAVILDQRSQAHASVGIARLLHSMRADVPVVLLSPEVLQPLPRGVTACLSGEDTLDRVVPTLNALLATTADRLACLAGLAR
jgi:hypothetical protein